MFLDRDGYDLQSTKGRHGSGNGLLGSGIRLRLLQLNFRKIECTTDSYRKSVYSIVGNFRPYFNTQNEFNHALDLFFVCSAVARDCLLYLQWGKLMNIETLISCHKQEYSSDLANLQNCFDIFKKEDAFDGHRIRLVFFDEFFEEIINVFDPVSVGDIGLRSKHAKIHGSIILSIVINNAITD